MDVAQFYPENYQEAHGRFCKAIERLGWSLETKTYPSRGLEGEPLVTAVAKHHQESIDGEHANRAKTTPTLVISTALHGIEGFFGSAVLMELLARYEQHGVPELNVLLMHALNPYGYSHLRRCDESNRDLNRNFLVGDQRYRGAPDLYRQLDPFLNPHGVPVSWEPFAAKAASIAMRYGFRAVQSAIAEGQYDYPKGLFYGGDRLSELGEWLRANFSSWLGDSQRVIHLDFHTGLGRRGTYKLMFETEVHDREWSEWQEYFESRNLLRLQLPEQPGSIPGKTKQGISTKQPYQARGTLGRWCQQLLGIDDYTFAVVEFGTLHPVNVLKALRAENQWHHWSENSDTSGSRASKRRNLFKQRLLDAFCPRSPAWRETCLRQAVEVVENVTQLLVEHDSAKLA